MMRNFLFLIGLFAGISLAAEGEYPERALPPADALARVTAVEGFEVDLIAAEPDIVQPIALCFDNKGRLWVAEAMEYPLRAAEGEGRDRIVVFSDEDGDGTYETRKIFYEGLNLVSGIEHGFGGLYVGAAPYLLFIPDADGDGVADGEPEVLLDGWGYHDTHEVLNSLCWGPDGWLYGCHGVFTHSRVGKPGTPDAERLPIDGGFWRYHPVRREFEVFAEGTSNPWGIDFNDWGEMFAEVCVIPHLWHIIPGARFQRQIGHHFNPYTYAEIPTIADHVHWVGNIADHAGWHNQDLVEISESVSDVGGGHAHSGLAICLIDEFPAEMRNDALFFNIHGHRMNHDKIRPKGSGYHGSHAPDVMLSNDVRFLGLSLRQGPGGALFYSDWQDDTSCHRTEPERWERDDGRVYRLRYGELQPWSGDLDKSSDLELAKTQAERDEWVLRRARVVLQQRAAEGKGIDAAALEFLRETLASHQDVTRRLRAMWTLHACGALDPSELLDHADPHILNWAIRLDAEDGEISEDALARWVELAEETSSPVVQLALCSALQRLPGAVAFRLAQALGPRLDPGDPNTSVMFWYGLEPLVPDRPTEALKLALECPDNQILGWVARRLEQKDAPDRIIALLDSPKKPVSLVYEVLRRRLQEHEDESIGAEALSGLEKLAKEGPEELRESAAVVGVTAGSLVLRELVWEVLAEGGGARDKRLEALGALANRWQEGDRERLIPVLGQRDIRLEVLESAPGLLENENLLNFLPELSDQEAQRLLRLAQRQERISLLLDWFAGGGLEPGIMPADLLVTLRRSASEKEGERIEQIWPTKKASGAEGQIAEWKEKLSAERLASADVLQGHRVYERTCAACHKLFGEGGEIGPELTGGDRGSLDHWLENIITPNALIGEGYELVQIEHGGQMSVGMLAHEDKDILVLRMVGHEETIRKDGITARKPLGISMMPEGLLSSLNDDEVASLIAYLMAPTAPESRGEE